MSTDVVHFSADAAAGASAPMKRELTDGPEPPSKVPKTSPEITPTLPPTTLPQIKASKVEDDKANQVRKVRLDQNRKAAKESRRRKKVMIEELQRSVIFFSRANGALKQQNDELTRLLIKAQAEVDPENTEKEDAKKILESNQEAFKDGGFDQADAEAVATQAVYERQGFSSAAARAAAQTIKGTGAQLGSVVAASPASLPAMQTGSTMQAMANFQQAAAAAMQIAMQGMNQAIPGVSMSQLSATPAGANAQQAYTDTMTALAMQQAAAAAATGQQFNIQPGMPFMMNPMFPWPQAFGAKAEEGKDSEEASMK